MRAFTPKMGQNVIIVTPGFFECVGQDWQAVEGTLLVNGLSETANGASVPGQPGVIYGHGTKGIEKATEGRCLWAGISQQDFTVAQGVGPRLGHCIGH